MLGHGVLRRKIVSTELCDCCPTEENGTLYEHGILAEDPQSKVPCTPWGVALPPARSNHDVDLIDLKDGPHYHIDVNDIYNMASKCGVLCRDTMSDVSIYASSTPGYYKKGHVQSRDIRRNSSCVVLPSTRSKLKSGVQRVDSRLELQSAIASALELQSVDW